MAESAIPRSPPASQPKPALGRLWQVLSLPLFFFLILPIVALFLRTSPAEIIENLSQPQVLQAIALSLSTTATSTVIIVLIGTPVAYSLARDRLPYRRVVDTLIDMPTVLPPAVAGVALLMAFGRRGILGSALAAAGLQIAFTPVAVMMAQIFIAAPFYIKAATIGFTHIEIELEQAAALDGASSWEVFRYVTIPLSWTGLLSGSVMSWARALGEFGATIIFAGNLPGVTQTMPLAIYLGFQIDLDMALTLSVILVGFSFLALVVVKGLLEREEST